MTLRSYNYGGGVQSTALLVLVATGRLPGGVFLFANTGDDSEDPRTLAYVRDVAAPYAAAHGVELLVLEPAETLLSRMERTAGDLIPFMVGPRGRGKRSCTSEWKTRRVGAELRRRGASAEDPAEVVLGISTDEWQRANTSRAAEWERIVYPLLDLGLSRLDCMNTIRAAGLPVPPKSACWFCPFRSPLAWAEMKRDRPELFARAVALETDKSARAVARGRRPLTLLRSYRPLETVETVGDELPFGDDGCDDNAGCWL